MTFFFNTMILDYPDVSDLACNCEGFFGAKNEC